MLRRWQPHAAAALVPAPVANVFADSVNGLDANSGLSSAQAKQTLSAALALMSSGMILSLAKGSTWAEQLTLTANDVLITTHGSGALPLIDASDAVPAVSWSLESGTTYQASVVLTGGTGTEWRAAWDVNAYLTEASSLANCRATPGSFFFSSASSATPTLYVTLSDGTNPGSNGRAVSFTCRARGIALTGNGCRVENVRTRRQRHNDGSLVMYGDYCWAVGCTIENGHKHSALTQEGGGFRTCTFKDNYWGLTAGTNFLVFNKDAGASLGISSIGNTFSQDTAVVPSSAGVPLQFPSMIAAHTNLSGAFGTLTSQADSGTFCSGAPAADNTATLNINNVTLLNCPAVVAGGNGQTANVTGGSLTVNAAIAGIITLVESSCTGVGRLAANFSGFTSSTSTCDVRIHGNNVDLAISGGSYFEAGDTSSRFPLGVIQMGTTTGCAYGLNNSTIKTGYQFDGFVNLAADTILNPSNNNTYIGKTSRYWYRANAIPPGMSNPSTIVEWRTYSGQDANSTASVY